MARVRLPAAGDEKARNLLLGHFATAHDLRKAVKKEVKTRWPSYWDKLKNDFKYETLEF